MTIKENIIQKKKRKKKKASKTKLHTKLVLSGNLSATQFRLGKTTSTYQKMEYFPPTCQSLYSAFYIHYNMYTALSLRR